MNAEEKFKILVSEFIRFEKESIAEANEIRWEHAAINLNPDETLIGGFVETYMKKRVAAAQERLHWLQRMEKDGWW